MSVNRECGLYEWISVAHSSGSSHQPNNGEPTLLRDSAMSSRSLQKRKSLSLLRMWLSQQNACLACTKPWVQSSAPRELGMVVCTQNPSAQELEAGGSEVEVHSQLHNKFETSLDPMRPCLKTDENYEKCIRPESQ